MSTVENPRRPAPSGRARIIAGAIAAAAVATPFIVDLEENRLASYRDIVGVWTVCAGVTGPEAGPGKSYTDEQCADLNKRKVVHYLTGIANCVDRELPAEQWVALGSWTYNIGIGAACKSTLVRLLNAGEPAEVWCRQLLRWDYAGGRKVRGLTRRRIKELDWCLRGATTAGHPASQ